MEAKTCADDWRIKRSKSAGDSCGNNSLEKGIRKDFKAIDRNKQ